MQGKCGDSPTGRRRRRWGVEHGQNTALPRVASHILAALRIADFEFAGGHPANPDIPRGQPASQFLLTQDHRTMSQTEFGFFQVLSQVHLGQYQGSGSRHREAMPRQHARHAAMQPAASQYACFPRGWSRIQANKPAICAVPGVFYFCSCPR